MKYQLNNETEIIKIIFNGLLAEEFQNKLEFFNKNYILLSEKGK